MALSALDDKSREPDDEILAGVLGKSKGSWDVILAHLANVETVKKLVELKMTH